jgi:hypothetical protein
LRRRTITVETESKCAEAFEQRKKRRKRKKKRGKGFEVLGAGVIYI